MGRTDRGRRRQDNEDAFRIFRDEVFVVADGMGGHAAGEVASEIMVDVVTACVETRHFAPGPPSGPRGAGAELVDAVRTANRVIYDFAGREPSLHGMGTTVVALRLSPGRTRAFVAHVGDSRCYRFREGELVQLTRDHTLATLGATGRDRAKLFRAAGVAENVEVELTIDRCSEGDTYLLCSDGISRMLPDEEMQSIISSAGGLDAAATQLVDAANERGGKDNATAVLVRLEPPA